MTTSQVSNFYQKLIKDIPDEVVLDIQYSDKWCFVETNISGGFAMRCPSHQAINLDSLQSKKTLKELASEISSFNFGHASVAMAAINCHFNSKKILKINYPHINFPSSTDLSELLIQKYQHKSIVSIGSFAFLKRLKLTNLSIIEKSPKSNEYPDTASEYLIDNADLVLITGATLINKSFERLTQLSQKKEVFLIGPSVPFIPDFYSSNISLFGYCILQNKEFINSFQQGLGKKLLSSNSIARLDYNI